MASNKITAKDLRVALISSKLANEFVRQHHYSGKVVPNSKLHFGVYLGNVLHGVMSYGSPMDKSKVIGLVDAGLPKEKAWNSMLELNRMAFDAVLPKNSESRALAVSFRLLRKNAPHIKWILSFSDGTASGDGTIYRASGFSLTQVKENSTLYIFPDGARIASLTLTNGGDQANRLKACRKYGIKYVPGASMRPFIEAGAYPAPGYQLRYIKVLDPSAKIACPILPFSAIDEIGAGMLRGKQITRAERMGK